VNVGRECVGLIYGVIVQANRNEFGTTGLCVRNCAASATCADGGTASIKDPESFGACARIGCYVKSLNGDEVGCIGDAKRDRRERRIELIGSKVKARWVRTL
jgi:hypothetical protein